MVEAWTGVILDVDEPSNTDLGYHGGNEIDRINKLLNGVNLTVDEGADVTINTNWYFYDNKLKINDGEGHTITIALPDDLSSDKTVKLPNANATLATSISATPNDFGENLQQFVSNFFKIKDPDQSHGINFKVAGMTENRPILFPVPGHATDEEVIYSHKSGQVLYDKVLSSPTFSTINLFIDSNTIKHSTTNNNNDILVYKNSASKYDRFPRGSAGQYLRTSLDGTFIEWATIPTSSGGGGGTGDYLLPIVGNKTIGAWFGTSSTGADGLWNDKLTNVGTTPSSITDNTGRIGQRYVTTADDEKAGFRTGSSFLTLLNDPELFFRYKVDLTVPMGSTQDDDYKLVCGFVSNVSGDYGSDNAFDSTNGFVWGKEISDTLNQVFRNDGSGSQVKSTTVQLASTNEAIHTVYLKGESSPTPRWGISLDGGAMTYYTTDIPATTTRLGHIIQFENEDSNDRAFELYGAYCTAKRI